MHEITDNLRKSATQSSLVYGGVDQNLTMYRKTMILLCVTLCYGIRVGATITNDTVCYRKTTSNTWKWCQKTLMLCDSGVAYNISVVPGDDDGQCNNRCSETFEPTNSPYDLIMLSTRCQRQSVCNMTWFSIPSRNSGQFGHIYVTYSCTNTATTFTSMNNTLLSTIDTSTQPTGASPEPTRTSSKPTGISQEPTQTNPQSTGISQEPTWTGQQPTWTSLGHDNISSVAHLFTDSDDHYKAVVAVFVVITVVIVLLVVVVMMYRRGKCKLLFGQCQKKYGKHTPETTDAMSSTATENLTYNFNSDVDINSCDVDYCEIDRAGKEIGDKYNHVNEKKEHAVQDSTYNHIGHFNSLSGDTEQTYNHVDDKSLQNTNLSSLQLDTYSHIGAMAKSASGQLADDFYAQVNGVIKYIPSTDDVNHYDCTVFESNGGPTRSFGTQERDIRSEKENAFTVDEPSMVDINNEAPDSNFYFILEQHEKEA